MHKHDVRRQTDNRIEKVRLAYSLHGMPFPEQHIEWLRSHVDSYAYGKFITNMATKALHIYTKENTMTPLQAAINKRDSLTAQRLKNRFDMDEYEKSRDSLAVRNAEITTELLALSATIGAEERKEREAEHTAMADELTAAGYKVVVPVTGSMKYPQLQQIQKGFKPGDLIVVGAPAGRGKTRFIEDLIAKHGDMPVYDTTTGRPAGMLSSLSYLHTMPYGDHSGIALSGGGKAPGMNTPSTGAGSAQPAPKLGGVHGVGEGWYSPIVYGSNGVKLEHDFAINTRDHHEAHSQWWLKHVPTGVITKGFPNEHEVHRWIRGRMDKNNFYDPKWSLVNWRANEYANIK